MNDPMIIAAALVLVIAASGSWVVQIINAKAAADERKEAKASRAKIESVTDLTAIKADRIIEQGVEIHTLTNSNLSKVTAELVTALSKIESLERLILAQNRAKEVADILATAHVVAPATNSIAEPKILESIKENTKDTVDAVKDLKERRKL